MRRKRFQIGIVTKRFPVSFLSEVVYFTQPMPRELAETIRTLRRPWIDLRCGDVALSESDPNLGECLTFGKALTERAVLELKDEDTGWK